MFKNVSVCSLKVTVYGGLERVHLYEHTTTCRLVNTGTNTDHTRSPPAAAGLRRVARHRGLVVHGLVRRQRHAERRQAVGLPQAGPPIFHEHRNSNASGRIQSANVQIVGALLLHCPLRLVPVVLEPNLDLGRREADEAREVLPLGGRQVPLLAKPPF